MSGRAGNEGGRGREGSSGSVLWRRGFGGAGEAVARSARDGRKGGGPGEAEAKTEAARAREGRLPLEKRREGAPMAAVLPTTPKAVRRIGGGPLPMSMPMPPPLPPLLRLEQSAGAGSRRMSRRGADRRGRRVRSVSGGLGLGMGVGPQLVRWCSICDL